MAAVLKPILRFRDCNLMLGVDAFNRHHAIRDMFLFNQARIAGKQRPIKNGLSATTT